VKSPKTCLLLSFATLVLIIGCAPFPSISKDCDELAPKFLKMRFAQAAKNHGSYTKEVVVIQSERQIPIASNNSLLHTFNLYRISTGGEVNKSSISRLGWVLEPYGKTIPNVNTSSQISCNYVLYEGHEYIYTPHDNAYKITNLSIDAFGANVNASEDKDGIYWKDYSGMTIFQGVRKYSRLP
jgi:hypothetical protein